MASEPGRRPTSSRRCARAGRPTVRPTIRRFRTPPIPPCGTTTSATCGPSSARSRRSTSRTASTTRSEEHTSELQSLMRISYAVFCLKKKKHPKQNATTHYNQPMHTQQNNKNTTNTQIKQYHQVTQIPTTHKK